MSTQLMLVDDDQALCRLVSEELREHDYEVLAVHSGEDALREFASIQPELVLLDLMLPGMSGLEVLRRLRGSATVPVIVFSARSGDADKVRGLEMGADDYVAKPYNPLELSARVRSVLRRQRRSVLQPRPLEIGAITVDLDRSRVAHSGEPIHLTRTEWKLLRYLAENRDRVLTAEEVLRRVWGPTYHDDLQYLRVWVSRLRRKLEPEVDANESMIRTFNGIGYMFDTTPVAESQRSDGRRGNGGPHENGLSATHNAAACINPENSWSDRGPGGCRAVASERDEPRLLPPASGVGGRRKHPGGLDPVQLEVQRRIGLRKHSQPRRAAELRGRIPEQRGSGSQAVRGRTTATDSCRPPRRVRAAAAPSGHSETSK